MVKTIKIHKEFVVGDGRPVIVPHFTSPPADDAHDALEAAAGAAAAAADGVMCDAPL